MRTSTSPASGPSEMNLRGGSFEGAPSRGLRTGDFGLPLRRPNNCPQAQKLRLPKATTTKSHGHLAKATVMRQAHDKPPCARPSGHRKSQPSEEPAIGRASHRKSQSSETLIRLAEQLLRRPHPPKEPAGRRESSWNWILTGIEGLQADLFSGGGSLFKRPGLHLGSLCLGGSCLGGLCLGGFPRSEMPHPSSGRIFSGSAGSIFG
ncbi:hypothetical protein GGQ10_003094 [Salinibacter ruber]|nr:hypothetical protein [Salinibacter ruber]